MKILIVRFQRILIVPYGFPHVARWFAIDHSFRIIGSKGKFLGNYFNEHLGKTGLLILFSSTLFRIKLNLFIFFLPIMQVFGELYFREHFRWKRIDGSL